MFTDWERSARVLVAKFRADSARHIGDPEFESLIAALRKTSPEFSRAWERHEVSQSGEGRKDLRHPLAGLMSFSHAVFHPAERLEQRLILYSPLPENDTAEKLAGLMESRPVAAPPVLPPRSPALVLAGVGPRRAPRGAPPLTKRRPRWCTFLGGRHCGLGVAVDLAALGLLHQRGRRLEALAIGLGELAGPRHEAGRRRPRSR